MVVLQQLCEHGAFLKLSDVDYQRVYGRPLEDPAAAAQPLLARGARLVCFTLGPAGCHVITPTDDFHLPARPVDVVDTTGAGDAFWSGFLAAHLNGHPPRDCARAGQALAALKLTRVGRVTSPPPLTELLR